eukprot:2905342-Prymnesium_polylepis.1
MASNSRFDKEAGKSRLSSSYAASNDPTATVLPTLSDTPEPANRDEAAQAGITCGMRAATGYHGATWSSICPHRLQHPSEWAQVLEHARLGLVAVHHFHPRVVGCHRQRDAVIHPHAFLQVWVRLRL